MNTSKNKPKRKWYNPNKLLSYNKFVNFVMSHRGGGKTYSAKRLAIKRFLDKEEQFIYMRRYKTELKGDNLAKWFDDISVEFEGHEFEVKGSTFYIDKKIAGYAVALTQQVQIRSTPYPLVTLIIFDEFVLDDRGTNLKYLNNEVKTFLEILSTVVRSRDNVRVLCCANSISYVNPYFDYWKIRIDPTNKKEFYFSPITDQVIVQLFDSEVFQEEMIQTRFGKLISGTPYGDYAINNEVLLDNQEFLMAKKPNDSQFEFSIKYDGKIYGCWHSSEFNIYHFNEQYDKSTKYCFSVTNEDQTYDMATLKSMKRNTFMQTLKMYYDKGLVFYNTQETKKDLYNIFKLIGI